jgi:molecular chaperone DnaK
MTSPSAAHSLLSGPAASRACRGVEEPQIEEVVLVGGQTRTPAVQERVTKVFGREPHKGVNPDEVVAIGAAVQAGVHAGEVKDVLLLDVTPLSLGVETLGGVMTVLIPRNTTLPARKSEVFSTAADNQPSVEIHVLQGERPLARDNRTLGKFHLDGIPPAPRGVPQVEVTFDLDANGILNVSAQDKASGKQQQITITASSGLTKDVVERMVKQADANAAEDAKRREEIERRNQLDALIYSTERSFNDHQSSLDQSQRTTIERALENAREAVKGSDAERMRRAQDSLTQAAQVLAEAASRPRAAAAGAGAGAGSRANTQGRPDAGGASSGDVIDAEVVETDQPGS